MKTKLLKPINNTGAGSSHQQDFLSRRLACRDKARMTGEYVTADIVIGRLERMLAEAKVRK